MVLLFYTTYISVDLAHHGIFHAKVGKGGIINDNPHFCETHSHNLMRGNCSPKCQFHQT